MGPGTGPLPRHAKWLEKCLGPRWHSLKKGFLRRQAINLVRGLESRWGGAPWGSRRASRSMRYMNAVFPESMSDGFDRLPSESRHTRPESRTEPLDRPKCLSIQQHPDWTPIFVLLHGMARVQLVCGNCFSHTKPRTRGVTLKKKVFEMFTKWS